MVTGGYGQIVNIVEFQSAHLREVWLVWSHDEKQPVSFNPHTYVRCDRLGIFTDLCDVGFNPHTYVRCDTCMALWDINQGCFNPHTYVRCDSLGKWESTATWGVSIRTPTWGVTLPRVARGGVEVFQSAHLREVWLTYQVIGKIIFCFNPHTYVRCDVCRQ